MLQAAAALRGLGKHTRCIGVMSSHDYRLLQMEAPQVPEEEMASALKWRIKDFIEYHPDEAVIDSFPIPGRSTNEAVRSVYTVVARRAQVKKRLKHLTGIGLEPREFGIRELALRNLSRFMPEDPKGVALLYLGQTAGSIAIVRDGLLYLTRQIETGSQRLHEAGLNHAGEGVAPALAAMLDGMVLELQRSLDYYESTFSKPPVNGLVVLPTAFPVPALIPYLMSNLGITARLFDLSAVCDTAGPLSDELQARCVIAVGAALGSEAK